MNKNLILAPSNKASLVKEWMSDKENRNFDVILVYYDEDGGEKDLEEFADIIFLRKGFKYPTIYNLIKTEMISIDNYDYIWLPDDDILLNTSQINQMFDLMKKYDLWLAMPSIIKGVGSFNTFSTQNHQDGNILRYVGFIEVQCPVFSKYAFQKCLNTFNESQSGWGIDLVWPKLLNRPLNKMAILDIIAAKHTRPVGHGDLYKRLNINPDIEMRILMKKYGVDRDANTYGTIKIS